MSEYLAHHGIKNQKWGQRRFQNLDGSLTPEGRVRYGVGEAQIRKTVDSNNESTKSSSSETGSEKRSATMLTPSELFEHKAEYSNEELKSAIERIKLVNELERLQLEDIQTTSKVSKELKSHDNTEIKTEIQKQKDQNELDSVKRSGEEAERQGEIKRTQQENELAYANQKKFELGMQKVDRARSVIEELVSYGNTAMLVYDTIAVMTGNDTIADKKRKRNDAEKEAKEKLEKKKREADEKAEKDAENKKQAAIARTKAQKDFDKYSEESAKLDAEVKGHKASRNEIQNERDKLKGELDAKDQEVKSLESKLNSLAASGKQSSQDYSDATDSLKKAKAESDALRIGIKGQDTLLSKVDKDIADTYKRAERNSEKLMTAATVNEFFRSNNTATLTDVQAAFDKYSIINSLATGAVNKPQTVSGKKK